MHTRNSTFQIIEPGHREGSWRTSYKEEEEEEEEEEERREQASARGRDRLRWPTARRLVVLTVTLALNLIVEVGGDVRYGRTGRIEG